MNCCIWWSDHLLPPITIHMYVYKFILLTLQALYVYKTHDNRLVNVRETGMIYIMLDYFIDNIFVWWTRGSTDDWYYKLGSGTRRFFLRAHGI